MNEPGFSPLGAALDYDARIDAASAWCKMHIREVKAGGLTIKDAARQLLAGRLYRVDTGSAGFDCVVDADSEDEAIELVCDHVNASGETADMLRTKFDPWSAQQVTIGCVK